MFLRRSILSVVLLLSPLSVLYSGTATGGDLLAYKPYTAGPLEYHLRIMSHAVIDSGPVGIQEGIFRDHEDILTLSQQVKDAGDGLLDIITTVKNPY